MAGISNSSLER